MASKPTIKANSLAASVATNLDPPLLYVPRTESHLHGRRFGYRFAQRGVGSLLLSSEETQLCVT